VPPYYPIVDGFDPQLSLSDRDMQDLQRWGFNALRVRPPLSEFFSIVCAAGELELDRACFTQLGVMWPGVAPTNGTFNQTYIDVMSTLIKKLGSYGIYTIVGECEISTSSPLSLSLSVSL
jgi:hypothetical protein